MSYVDTLIVELDEAIAGEDFLTAGARFKELRELADGDYGTVEHWIRGAHGHDEDN